MILQARTENTEMFIAMYETEEPKFKSSEGVGHYNHEHWKLERTLFEKRLQQWQSSKREYKVRSEDKEEIEGILFAKFVKENKDLNHFGHVFIEILEGGIDCTFLKDRLKEATEEFIHPNGASELITVWTLLPLEDKKENEAVEKGLTAFKNIQMAAKVELILKPEYMNSVFTWKQIQDAILSDYKQTIQEP